jgi:hypothetical protein
MTAQELIRALDTELDGATIDALDNAQLTKLENLLYHWQSVTDAALAYRRKSNSEPGAAP